MLALPAPFCQALWTRGHGMALLVAAMKLGETDFLTYDRRQARAAAERGFTVVSPGRHPGWYAL